MRGVWGGMLLVARLNCLSQTKAMRRSCWDSSSLTSADTHLFKRWNGARIATTSELRALLLWALEQAGFMQFAL